MRWGRGRSANAGRRARTGLGPRGAPGPPEEPHRSSGRAAPRRTAPELRTPAGAARSLSERGLPGHAPGSAARRTRAAGQAEPHRGPGRATSTRRPAADHTGTLNPRAFRAIAQRTRTAEARARLGRLAHPGRRRGGAAPRSGPCHEHASPCGRSERSPLRRSSPRGAPRRHNNRNCSTTGASTSGSGTGSGLRTSYPVLGASPCRRSNGATRSPSRCRYSFRT
jgi:hypothetical protein